MGDALWGLCAPWVLSLPIEQKNMHATASTFMRVLWVVINQNICTNFLANFRLLLGLTGFRKVVAKVNF